MLWDDQKAKDMELYPMIEPFVNFTREKFNSITNGTHKVALDLHHFAKTGSKRVL